MTVQATDIKAREAARLTAFTRAAVANPAIIEDAPDGKAVIFFPDDDEATIEAGIELGLREVCRRQTVTFRFVTPEELAAWEAAAAEAGMSSGRGSDVRAAPTESAAAKSA